MNGSERIERAIALQGDSLPWRKSPVKRLLKRAVDVAIAAPATLVALPIMGAVAGLVRATSPGPVLFGQDRLGLDGKPFKMWKFRTMRADNADGSAKGSGEVSRTDNRLTPVGAMLRDWRLDELPQLLHVLAGQMSLVGPRPDLASNLPVYRDEDLVRFAMPPGCTTMAFTTGAFANEFQARQAINAEYVRRWSVLLDLKIIARTALVLLRQENTAPR